MEDRYGLESALKSLILECMKDPEVQKRLKNAAEGSLEEHQTDSEGNNENLDVLERDDRVGKIEANNLESKIDNLEGKINQLINYMKVEHAEKGIENDSQKNNKESLFSNKLSKESSEKYKLLINKCSMLEEERERLAREKANLQIENDNLRHLQEEYQDFEKCAEVWKSLKTLSEESKDYIEKLCGNFAMHACFSLGRNIEKVDQLWDYLKNKVLKPDSDSKEIEKLISFFELCLDVANSISSVQDQFSGFELPSGSDYDMNRCIRTTDGKHVGMIKETLVRGYERNGKIIYKSIVRLG